MIEQSTQNVFTIPATVSFADALVGQLIDTYGLASPELTKLRLLLPTRRACRVIQDTFLRLSDGKPTLLPQLQPLGDVEEDELFIEMAALHQADEILNLPPALPKLQRQILLMKLIMKTSDFKRPDQALDLAAALGRLMDQVYTEDLDMSQLHDLVPDEFAQHWQITIEFLKILSQYWPEILAERGVIDYADRRNRLLKTLAQHWQETPPQTPIIAAGSTGSIPATAQLLKTITQLPKGQIILPGLDQIMDEKSWENMDESHPQATLKNLLQSIGIERKDVTTWPGTYQSEDERTTRQAKAREWLSSEMMRPVDTADKWTSLNLNDDQKAHFKNSLDGIRRIDCSTSQDEAHVIAMIMREALEEPGKRVTLITPDRVLARRISAACKRWDILLDDSAGQPLSDAALGSFIDLAIEAPLSGYKPSTLLALLKSSYSTLGHNKKSLKKAINDLEIHYLRGPKPAYGLEGLRSHIDTQNQDEQIRPIPEDIKNQTDEFLAQLEHVFEEFETLTSKTRVPFKAFLQAHLNLMETLAQTEDMTGAEKLWAGEAGQSASVFFASLLETAHEFQDVSISEYRHILKHFIKSVVIRPKWGLHPRLAILGQLEARLVQADIVILAGLNEGTWPPDPGHDPWMSRPMRMNFGLPSPERSICLAAHDFVQGFCAPEVVITRAQQVDGTPQIPARWLLRMNTVLQALGIQPETLSDTKYKDWAYQLDHDTDTPTPIKAPAPCPTRDKRPTRLSVTAIQNWMADPYAIYAQYVLGLYKLKPLEEKADAAMRGNVIHKILELFIERYKTTLPGNAYAELLQIGKTEIEALDNAKLVAFWWPRFERLAKWFIDNEVAWRAQGFAPAVLENKGLHTILTDTDRPFTISAKADRIDVTATNSGAIIDYKTGTTASARDIAYGYKPQLPLEAMILKYNGFGGLSVKQIDYIGFWKLSGGREPGKEEAVKLSQIQKHLPNIDSFDDLAIHAEEGLTNLVKAFDNDNVPYHSLPRPDKAPPEDWQDYRHLARVQEWSAFDDSEASGS